MASPPMNSPLRQWDGSLHNSLNVTNPEESFVFEDSEVHPGAHRDGYSEEKCRNVLVLFCSKIPRNYNYTDGLQLVYETLREYFGDENLDLSIGVLYELIELKANYTWEEGGAFRRWSHAHSLRAKDLSNTHIPRLGNIVVGTVVPTERLRHWRSQLLAPPRGDGSLPSSLERISLMSPSLPSFGIRSRPDWQIEHSTFVSSPGQGTKVAACPSARELHEMYWNPSYGRGGRFVDERSFEPTGAMGNFPRQSAAPSTSGFRLTQQPGLVPIPEHQGARGGLKKSCLSVRLRKDGNGFNRVRCGHAVGDHALGSVAVYEDNIAVKTLPDHNAPGGRSYYATIQTQPLPPGYIVPNPVFARKHSLLPKDSHLPGDLSVGLMPYAEELGVQKARHSLQRMLTFGSIFDFEGPFTGELFRDGGLDFSWQQRRKSVPREPVTLENRAYTPQRRNRSGPDYPLPVSPWLGKRDAEPVSPSDHDGTALVRHEILTDFSRLGDGSFDAPPQHARGTEPRRFQRVIRTRNCPTRHNPLVAMNRTGFRTGHTLSKMLFDKNARNVVFVSPLQLYKPGSINIIRACHGSEDAHRLNSQRSISVVKSEPHPPVRDFATENNRFPGDSNSPLRHHSALCEMGFPQDRNAPQSSPEVCKTEVGLGVQIDSVGLAEVVGCTQSEVNHLNLSAVSRPKVVLTTANPSVLSCHGVFDCEGEDPTLAAGQYPEDPDVGRTGLMQKMTNSTANPNEVFQGSREVHRDGVSLVDDTTSLPTNTSAPPLIFSNDGENHPNYHLYNNTLNHQMDHDNIKWHDSLATRPVLNLDRELPAIPEPTPTLPLVINKESSQQKPLTPLTQRSFNSNKSRSTQASSNPEHRHMRDLLHSDRRRGTNNTHRSGASVSSIGRVSNNTSGSSFSIMGNFIPVNSPSRHEGSYNSPTDFYREMASHNPYAQDDDATSESSRVTRMEDFLAPLAPDSAYKVSGRQASGLKNSRSESNVVYNKPVDTDSQRLARPNGRRTGSPSRAPPSMPKTYADHQRLAYGPDENASFIPNTPSKAGTRAPRKNLTDKQEYEDASDHEEPPRRPRSPMKKLFGDGGWLGHSAGHDEASSNKYKGKKQGVIAVIKTKIEEFAEKADLSPRKFTFKSEARAAIAPTKFRISLSSPRQAQIYIDLELLICSSANRYLLEQYQAGNMGLETLRKTTEDWRAKGRAQVVDFQYDQGTQRDLIEYNLKTFQFHGAKATNPQQIDAVLWCWKENAREMSVRTFCTADSVIKKQLHDTYHVLDLLGAHPITFLALQNLQGKFTTWVREADAKEADAKVANAAAASSPRNNRPSPVSQAPRRYPSPSPTKQHHGFSTNRER